MPGRADAGGARGRRSAPGHGHALAAPGPVPLFGLAFRSGGRRARPAPTDRRNPITKLVAGPGGTGPVPDAAHRSGSCSTSWAAFDRADALWCYGMAVLARRRRVGCCSHSCVPLAGRWSPARRTVRTRTVNTTVLWWAAEPRDNGIGLVAPSALVAARDRVLAAHYGCCRSTVMTG